MQVGQAEIAILSLYLALLCAVKAATGQVLSTWRRRTTIPQVVTLIAGSKRRSLLLAGDERRRNVCDKKSQRYAKDNRTAFNCIRRDKSVACVPVTNNKRLCLTFCTIEANY